MPQFKIDLRERFTASFGFAANNIASQVIRQNYSIPQPYINDEVVAQSKMGTPLFERFEFDYKASDGSTQKYIFEIPPMVDLSISKRINVTTINDAEVDGEIIGGGEVIESWGNESWDITFRGLLVDMDNHRMPKQQIDEVVRLFKVNNVLEVRSSKLFNSVGISQIYIKSLQFNSLEGFVDTQPFTIQAKSYVPAALEITD